MEDRTSAATTPGDGAHLADSVSRDGFTLLVGTFRSPELYVMRFNPPQPSSSHADGISTTKGLLAVAHKASALAGHSWLSLSPDHSHLYTTNWADPPSVGAYALDRASGLPIPTPLNTASVASLSGYVVVSPSGRHLISVGGPTGEVFRLEDDGRIGPLVQTLVFRKPAELADGAREGVAHGSFGGLRWGAHSVDLSPDGKSVYVADIGHNCIWTYSLNEAVDTGATNTTAIGNGEGSNGNGNGYGENTNKNIQLLTLTSKHISVRPTDGPRHCWPHPNGAVLYVVQEHSSMVDAFRVIDPQEEDAGTTTLLSHMSGASIIPPSAMPKDFWADEVRTSTIGADEGRRPRWLYASTRGLQPETKGYVAAYALDGNGALESSKAAAIYETRMSGGLANAIEPAPREVYQRLGLLDNSDNEIEEYIALTDSEQGWVTILGWNGKAFREVAATRLGARDDDSVVQAATAVWV
ncbi:hypothetical protein BD289DRAFT_285257 [Coniella lustricola]|uniref:Lactonase, 7-bladed beta-propeller-domain-containing protein n=1 Tax=Coniella lustricola TaxID=2025994 RepID=A0A2T3AK58_9PEZI|nr:hypothetical protein BD289DRAFT_285257 [Coniella lustricola]